MFELATFYNNSSRVKRYRSGCNETHNLVSWTLYQDVQHINKSRLNLWNYGTTNCFALFKITFFW